MKYQRIPRSFTQQNQFAMIRMVTHRVLSYILALTVLSFLFGSELPLYLKVLAATPLVFWGSIALHNIGLLGHEGTHFTLAQKHYTSALLGTFFSTMVPLHFNTGFALTHALHHWHTNTENDPDYPLFSTFKNFWSRMLLARSKASRSYLKNTIQLALGKMPYPNQVGLKDKELFRLAQINMLLSLFFLLVYAVLIAFYLKSFGIAFLLIYVIAFFLSGLRPYMEHAGTDASAFSNSRTFSSPTLDYIFGTINYHLAHHMHPAVPAYSLPALHKWMVQEGHIDTSAAIHTSSVIKLMSQVNNSLYGKTGAQVLKS